MIPPAVCSLLKVRLSPVHWPVTIRSLLNSSAPINKSTIVITSVKDVGRTKMPGKFGFRGSINFRRISMNY